MAEPHDGRIAKVPRPLTTNTSDELITPLCHKLSPCLHLTISRVATHKISKFPDFSLTYFHFPLTNETYKNCDMYVLVWLYTLLIIMYMSVYVSNRKSRTKCVERYDTSAEGVSWKFVDMLIDHRNLLWNINFLKFPWLFLNFPDFQLNSNFPWKILKFPDFSLTLNFPDFSLTSGNPDKT